MGNKTIQAAAVWLIAAAVVLLVWSGIAAFMRVGNHPVLRLPTTKSGGTVCGESTVGMTLKNPEWAYGCKQNTDGTFAWVALPVCQPQIGFYSAAAALAGRPVEIWEGPTGRQWLVTHHGPLGSAPKDYPALLDIVQVPEEIRCKLGVSLRGNWQVRKHENNRVSPAGVP